MSKLIKILPLFLLTALLVAGCDFGKAPDMDKVRDVLMEEYGAEAFPDDEVAGEAVGDETKSGPFAFGPECDEQCQEGFQTYLITVYGEEGVSDCDDECKAAEYEIYLALVEQLGLGGGGQ